MQGEAVMKTGIEQIKALKAAVELFGHVTGKDTVQ
jgi:hypothetical protein